MLRLFRVSGSSMQPTFREGAILLTLRLPDRCLSVGRAVVLRVEGDGYIVKRIAALVDSESLRLCSDNPASSSVYCEEQIARSSVVGQVILAFGRNPFHRP